MGKKANVPEVKSQIHVIIYKPISDIPETHRPEIKFEGEMLSMRDLDMIEIQIRKALRRFKLDCASSIKKNEGE